jgi:hypothetical protein
MLRSGRRGIEDALACGVPEAAVQLSSRLLNILSSTDSGSSSQELLAVLSWCGLCLQQLCLPAPDARTRVRLAGGIEGAGACWLCGAHCPAPPLRVCQPWSWSAMLLAATQAWSG